MRADIGYSMRYVGDWNGSLYRDWRSLRALYSESAYRLDQWKRVLGDARFDETVILPMLDNGMSALRRIDERVGPWFEDDIANMVERARWLDLAQGVACCGPSRDDALHEYYWALAEAADADSISPHYGTLGELLLFPPITAQGEVPAEPTAAMLVWLGDRMTSARQSDDGRAMRRFANLAAATLASYPDAASAAAAATMQLIGDRLRYADAPVSDLLAQAEALEAGPMRDALLDEAQDALHDRLGHLAPLLAAGADEAAEEDRIDAIDRFFAEAKRLAMLADDINDPFSAPSGLLRSISGLKAASGILGLDGGGTAGKDALGAINDLAGSFKYPVSPTAPFAGAGGMAVAQLGVTRRGWDLASEALGGIGDAMSGDAQGLQRAQEAAAELKEVLSPRNFGKRMAAGFVEGVASNVPFLRGFIDWLSE